MSGVAGSALQGQVSSLNNTTTALGANGVYVGTPEDVSQNASVVCAIKTDQDGTMYMEFSPDGVNWDSSLTLPVYA